MKIKNVKLHDLKPLVGNKTDFHLADGLTLIRGKNGAGKTTLLEACALLGHCSILPFTRKNPDCCSVKLELTIDNEEVIWLQNLMSSEGARSRSSNAVVRKLIENIDSFPKEYLTKQTQNPNRDFKRAILERLKSEDPLSIHFIETPIIHHNGLPNTYDHRGAKEHLTNLVHSHEKLSALLSTYNDEDLDDLFMNEVRTHLTECTTHMDETLISLETQKPSLKMCLSHESRLKKYWRIFVNNSSAPEIDALIVQLFIAFSRPSLKNDVDTLRRTWLEMHSDPKGLESIDVTKITPAPGFVSYFNTDMYEFGIGLDIRESPKDFSLNMQEMMDRLQVIDKRDLNDQKFYFQSLLSK